MPTIAPRTSINERPHFVRLQRPSVPVPDGDGSFDEEPYLDLDPPYVFARIQPATAQTMERIVAGATVVAQATHVISMPYHPQLTTLCQVLYNGRTFRVTGVGSPDELNVETIAICQELAS